jgi:anthraniloyl-CoA monooxygenase
MYETPFADRIRNEVGIATLAVGAITEADHANSIIAAGRADLCDVARPHLADPAWTLHQAAALNLNPVYGLGTAHVTFRVAHASKRSDTCDRLRGLRLRLRGHDEHTSRSVRSPVGA